jgi:ketosteroid isomerase-like protein
MNVQTAGKPAAAESHPFIEALFARDFAAMGEAVTPDVVLNSPILTTPFQGREAVIELFVAVLDTLEDIQYTADLTNGDTRIMVFRSRIAGKVEAESIDIMRLAEDGRIREFTIMFRPLVATTTLASELGKRLGARRARWRGWLAGAASRPPVWMARVSDRVAPRLVK